MAGGIDWFRWHHGSVTDPKFALVARKSGASLPDVLAVWAYILECASAAEERGRFGQIDCEAVDCLFNFPSTETRTADILKAMEQRELTANGRIVAWEIRQPKRERENDNSTDRVRAHRERKRHETPSNASDGTGTPRGEESRGDISTSLRSVEAAPKRASRKCPKDFEVTSEMLRWALETYPNVDAALETAKFKDHTFKNAISDWPGAWRNWIRKADEIRPNARASPQSFRQQDADTAAARVAAFTGNLVSAKPSRPAEVIDVTSRSLDRSDLLEDDRHLRGGVVAHVGGR